MTATLGPREYRLRPVRALEIAAVICLVALILWVYVAKASGADESAAIRQTRAEIAEQQRSLRLLRAEAASLESPTRLDALVREHSDLAPVDPARQARPEAIDGLAGAPVADPVAEADGEAASRASLIAPSVADAEDLASPAAEPVAVVEAPL